MIIITQIMIITIIIEIITILLLLLIMIIILIIKNPDRFNLNPERVHITVQEMCCVFWLSQGGTVNQRCRALELVEWSYNR